MQKNTISISIASCKKIIASIPDGSGVIMVEGKMQDDATVKQAQNIIKMAEMIQEKDNIAL